MWFGTSWRHGLPLATCPSPTSSAAFRGNRADDSGVRTAYGTPSLTCLGLCPWSWPCTITPLGPRYHLQPGNRPTIRLTDCVRLSLCLQCMCPCSRLQEAPVDQTVTTGSRVSWTAVRGAGVLCREQTTGRQVLGSSKAAGRVRDECNVPGIAYWSCKYARMELFQALRDVATPRGLWHRVPTAPQAFVQEPQWARRLFLA